MNDCLTYYDQDNINYLLLLDNVKKSKIIGFSEIRFQMERKTEHNALSMII